MTEYKNNEENVAKIEEICKKIYNTTVIISIKKRSETAPQNITGLLIDIHPMKSVVTVANGTIDDGMRDNHPFAGWDQGIISIKSLEGKLIYKNNQIEAYYSKPVYQKTWLSPPKDDEKRRELVIEGIYYS